MKLILTSLAVIASLVLSGCSNQQAKPFELKNLAKSEIDMVTDSHMHEAEKQAKQLLVKLYKRNPRELRKAPAGTSIETRIEQLFKHPRQVQFNELGKAYGISAIPLAFDENYQGDRVFALMAGVVGMLHASYNFQDEFFLLDGLDQQKLYHSARNMESVAWMLNTRRDSRGELFLLSNGISLNQVPNYSYERIFGKLIAIQDMMAQIVSDTNNRTINKVVHGVASTTLLPI